MSIDGPYWPNELLIIKMALMDIALRFYSRFWLCGITVKKIYIGAENSQK